MCGHNTGLFVELSAFSALIIDRSALSGLTNREKKPSKNGQIQRPD